MEDKKQDRSIFRSFIEQSADVFLVPFFCIYRVVLVTKLKRGAKPKPEVNSGQRTKCRQPIHPNRHPWPSTGSCLENVNLGGSEAVIWTTCAAINSHARAHGSKDGEACQSGHQLDPDRKSSTTIGWIAIYTL